MTSRRYPQVGALKLIKLLGREFGYQLVRQRGSHLRLRTDQGGRHSITVPNHDPVRTGTLAGILADVAEHFGVDEKEVLSRIRGS